MTSPNEDQEPVDNMESLKQQASDCAPGCACHGTGSSGRIRWILGMTVLLVAATLVARAVVKNHEAATEPAVPTFAPPAPSMAADNPSPANLPDATPATEASVGKSISAFAELNTVAAASDAVFVYVPGKEGSPGNVPSMSMQDAARRIEAQGYKVGLFTLQAGSRDHEQILAQMSVPGVVAMVKGRGMSIVSGDITATKLIQGFVAASNCGPGGCGPAGCCPTGSK